MRGLRSGGPLGALLGVVALGGAIGLSAERYAVGRVRLRPDPDALEPFFRLPADRTRTVTTPDGVRLHVEEVGPQDAAQTVVLVHGYTQEMAVWHYQRKALSDGRLRVVLYDQRSHGRSTRSSPELSTIDQLGADLQQVLEEVVPTGDVVLVGHSMGGMTVMALADRAPELFGSRVRGVGLLSTSTGKLAQLTLRLPSALEPVAARGLPLLTRGLRSRAALLERGRRLGSDLAFLLARRGAFGSTDVSPSLVEFVETMLARTPVDVMAEFFETFASHDKLKALDALRGIPVLVLVGSKDLLTPVAHSRAIADALPEAQLVVVDGCGHMVNLERPSLVDLHVRSLVAKAAR